MQMMFFLIFFGGLYIGLKSLPNAFSKERRPYAEIVRDEFAPLAAVLALCAAALTIVYFFLFAVLHSASTRIESVVAIEAWLIEAKEKAGFLSLPIELVLALFAGLFILSFLRIADRFHALKRFDANPMQWLGKKVSLYRKTTTQIQVALLFLANVTFLGVAGTAVHEITTAQISKIEQGIASAHEAFEQRAFALALEEELAEEVSPIVFEDDPQIKGLRPTLKAIEDVIRSVPPSERRAFSDIRERSRQIERLVAATDRNLGTTETAVKPRLSTSSEEVRFKSDLTRVNINVRSTEQGYGKVSIGEAFEANHKADKVKERLNTLDKTAEETLYRSTIAAAAEAVVRPEKIAALELLAIEMPLMQPLIEGLVGAVREIAIQSQWNELRLPLNVLQGNRDAAKNWVHERIKQIRARFGKKIHDPIRRQAERMRNVNRDVNALSTEALEIRKAVVNELRNTVDQRIAELSQKMSHRFGEAWHKNLGDIRNNSQITSAFVSKLIDPKNNDYLRYNTNELPRPNFNIYLNPPKSENIEDNKTRYSNIIRDLEITLGKDLFGKENGPIRLEDYIIKNGFSSPLGKQILEIIDSKISYDSIERKTVSSLFTDISFEIRNISDPIKQQEALKNIESILAEKGSEYHLALRMAEIGGGALGLLALKRAAGYLGSSTYRSFAPSHPQAKVGTFAQSSSGSSPKYNYRPTVRPAR